MTKLQRGFGIFKKERQNAKSANWFCLDLALWLGYKNLRGL